MTREKLLAGYREITVGAIEPSQTIHVFTDKGGNAATPEGELRLAKILVIANPPVSDGEVRYRECKNGTPGKEIFSMPIEVFTGEKPNPDGFLFRILK